MLEAIASSITGAGYRAGIDLAIVVIKVPVPTLDTFG